MPNSLEDLTVDQLLQVANRAVRSEQALEALLANPGTREQQLRLLKKQNPSLSIPEIDARDSVMTEVSDTQKQLAEMRAQLQERDIRDRITKDRESIKSKYNFSESDLLEVEKLMIDEHAPISSYAAAAMVYDAQRQSAVPTSSALSAPVWDLPDQNIWSKGVGNRAQLDKIGMEQAYQALAEVKSGKVAGT